MESSIARGDYRRKNPAPSTGIVIGTHGRAALDRVRDSSPRARTAFARPEEFTKNLFGVALVVMTCFTGRFEAQDVTKTEFQPVPELAYRESPISFIRRTEWPSEKPRPVALNSKGNSFLFQRVEPVLAEYDGQGNFVRSLGEGLFTHPRGLRIDPEDNLWTTDDSSHLVLKLSPKGRVLLVLGRKGVAA